MFNRRFLRLDLLAGGLLVAGLAASMCLLTHDPANPGSNILGACGAATAEALANALGSAVWTLLGAWFVLVLLLLVRHQPVAWTLRLTGWILLVPIAAVTADSLQPALCGGWLGAGLDDLLTEYLAAGPRLVLGAIAILLTTALVCLGTTTWLIDEARYRLRRFRLPAPPQLRISLPWQTERPAVPSDVPIRHSEGQLTPEQALAAYEMPTLALLEDSQPVPQQEHDQLLRQRGILLEKTLADFNLNVKVVGINTGPVVTQYEVVLETGMRVNKITGMGDDLALNLRVPSVRIVAPIPGKNTVGVEIPNEHRQVVRLKEVMLASGFKPSARTGWAAKAKLPLFLGKDTEGKPLVCDLAELPHLLIAGRTGTGKSVCMNALILSILLTRRPDEVRLIMIDPKMLELSEYGKIPHLMHPVVKDMKKAEAILSWAVDKMEERYDILSRARVRNLAGYNELHPDEIIRRVRPMDDEERRRVPERMPYIVIFIDEMADLMMTMKKEVEGHIIRLAQKSRAAGIHLVVATQKPTVDVITGLIKSNLPARIAFQVSSRSDSRVVLDEMGADRLLGKGDMLFLQPGDGQLVRAQGTYASNEEIQKIVEHLECEPTYASELMQLSAAGRDGKAKMMDHLRARDELYVQAIEVVVREGRGSVSLLQRSLGIGYGRAARLIDFMAEDGIVGTYNGSQAREVLYTVEAWEQVKSSGRMAESA